MADITQNTRVAVLGAGAWGTALALLLATAGAAVTLWSRRPEHARQIQTDRENRDYLPGVILPENLGVTFRPAEAVRNAELAVVALPSKALVETLAVFPKAPAYLSATKGLHFVEHGLLRMSQEIAKLSGVKRVAAISGPNHAEEVGRFLPAAAVVASEDESLAVWVQQLFSGPSFRVYSSSDLAGVELGGALKNVIALAAGMVDGLGLGDNTKAALITRGLREIVRFGVAMGGQEATFYGLSGLGDLVGTATSKLSRNREAGERLVRGATLAGLEAQKQVVEGIYTVKAVHQWAEEQGQDLPITRAVYQVVHQGESPLKAVSSLMERESKAE